MLPYLPPAQLITRCYCSPQVRGELGIVKTKAVHSGRNLSPIDGVFLTCADSTDRETWKDLYTNEIAHAGVDGNVVVICSPPFGILAAANQALPHDDDGDDEDGDAEGDEAEPQAPHDPDVALKYEDINTFAAAMHRYLPDKAIVALHLCWSLFHMYDKRMRKNGWSMVNHPITITSPTAAPRGFQTTSMSANVDTFFVYHKSDARYKPSITYLKHLTEGDAAAKSLYNSLVRCGHMVKNKIPPAERCHLVRQLSEKSALRMQTQHAARIKKQVNEGKIDKAQGKKNKQHPNLVPCTRILFPPSHPRNRMYVCSSKTPRTNGT